MDKTRHLKMSSQGLETLINVFLHLQTFYRNTWYKMLNNFFKVEERQVILAPVYALFCASSEKLALRSWFLDALSICGFYTLKDAGILMHLHTVCGPLDYHVYFPCGPSLLMLFWMMLRCVKCYPLEGKRFFCILLITSHDAVVKWVNHFEGLLGQVCSFSFCPRHSYNFSFASLAYFHWSTPCFTLLVLFSFLHSMAANRLSLCLFFSWPSPELHHASSPGKTFASMYLFPVFFSCREWLFIVLDYNRTVRLWLCVCACACVCVCVWLDIYYSETRAEMSRQDRSQLN